MILYLQKLLENDMGQMNSESFDKQVLINEYGIKEEIINGQHSLFNDGELESIYTDYQNRLTDLERCKNKFLTEYLAKTGTLAYPYMVRVKNPYHVIEKIIRKKINNSQKYQNLTSLNYYQFITDLIGCRVLLVFKDDWNDVHKQLLSLFEFDRDRIIKNDDYVGFYQRKEEKPFIAEMPKVFLRAGDSDDIFRREEENRTVEIDKKGYYRSVHYVIRMEEYYIEVQVRSLFEEAWSAVDHRILYPYLKDDKNLVYFSQILNRVSGLGDEISLFFKNNYQTFRSSERVENTYKDTPIYQNDIERMDVDKLGTLRDNIDRKEDNKEELMTEKEVIDCIVLGGVKNEQKNQ